MGCGRTVMMETMITNHGYDARSVIRLGQLLKFGTDVFQKDDVSDCYGIPLDGLPDPRLHLWYKPSLIMWYRRIRAKITFRRRSTTDIPVLQSHRLCIPNCELILFSSDIGGTDRWTWFVSWATIQTRCGLNTNDVTGFGQPPSLGSSLPLCWFPLRSHGAPICRHTWRVLDHPGDDCSLDCSQHERLHW